jgi:hypothetical protein
LFPEPEKRLQDTLQLFGLVVKALKSGKPRILRA